MTFKKLSSLLSGTAIAATTLVSSCGAPSDGGSDLFAEGDAYSDFESREFEPACTLVAAPGTLAGDTARKALMTRTLELLFDRYKRIAPGASGTFANHCSSMATAWKDRRLDLSGVGPLSVMIVVKLWGLHELDLSNNGLTDEDLVYIKHHANSPHKNRVKDELRSLDLSHNKFKATNPAMLDLKSDYTKLQRLDYSYNDIATLAGPSGRLSLADSVFAVDLSHNPRLEIDRSQAIEWSKSMTTLNVSGTKRFDFGAINRFGIRSLASLVASRVGTVDYSGADCIDVQSPDKLIFASFAGSNVQAKVVSELLKKSCFKSLALVEVRGSSVEDRAAELEEVHGPRIDAQASCSGPIRALTETTGRIKSISCDGALTMPALGFEGQTSVVGSLPASYPVFTLAK